MTDRRVVLIVVIMLGVFALGGLAALTWLVHGKTPGDQLAIIAGPMGVALGALSAVLVSTRTVPADDPPQQVQVVNEGPSEAVPIAEAKRGKGDAGQSLVQVLTAVALVLVIVLLLRLL